MQAAKAEGSGIPDENTPAKTTGLPGTLSMAEGTLDGRGPLVPAFSTGRIQRSSSLQLPEKIEFLASDDFPPFVFRDSEQRLMGYNVDLARAICEELEIACSLRIKPFEKLKGALADFQGDVLIAGLPLTAENLKILEFSQVYLRFPGRFIVGRDLALPMEPRFLAGKKIGIVSGSRHEAYLEANVPLAKLVGFQDPNSAREALARKEVQAVFGDGLHMAFWLQSEAGRMCCQFAGGPYLDPTFLNQGLALNTRRGDKALMTALNQALSRLQLTGKMEELYLRYFPVGFY